MSPLSLLSREGVRMRYVLTGLVAGGLVALLVAVGAVSHSMSLRDCGLAPARWGALKLQQQERYIRCNLGHARSARAWIRSHRTLYPAGAARALIRSHRRLELRAARNLRALQDRIYFTGSWSERYRVVREIICSFDWSPTPCAGAVQVSRCETGGTFLAAPGDDPGSQYVGLFELGDYARTHYGVGSYRTADDEQAGRAGAWVQVLSAHNLYVSAGRSWGPWACRPDGSIAY